MGGKPAKGPGPDRGVVFQHFALFPWRSGDTVVIECEPSVPQDNINPAALVRGIIARRRKS